MGRVGIWVANGALLLLCCFLVAQVLSEFAGGWLSESPTALTETPPPPAPRARTWEERRVILERNLFNVSTLAPQQPVPEEELEATKLPLRLLATAVSTRPENSWAAVEDLENRLYLVVRRDDRLAGGAMVLRIDRRRIVLKNGPRREELALEGEDGVAPRNLRQTRLRSARSGRRPQVTRNLERLKKRLSEAGKNRMSVPREQAEATVRNPASLFSQARILPKYEGGQMVGLQLNAIKPGSLFEQMGIQNGDTVTELNGIEISSPQESATLLREFTQADEFTVIVRGADGQERTLTYELED